MGMTFPRPDGEWATLTKRLTDGWSFWDLFAQDSLLAVEQSGDETAYYRQLAVASTAANARFADALRDVPFESFLRAVDDFRFTACETWDALVEPVRALCR